MKKIIICVNYRANPVQPSCGARGSEAIALRIEKEIDERGLPIELERTYCLGHCEQGPNLRLAPNGEFFHRFNYQSIPRLLTAAMNCKQPGEPNKD